MALFSGWAVSVAAQTNERGEAVRERADIYFEEGKLNFATKNNNFRLKLDNRIYTDFSYYHPTTSVDGLSSKPNDDLEEDDGKFRFNNGVSVRRARLALKATLYEKWFAEFDLDFAYNEVEIKDMYLGYRFNDHVSVQAGHFKEPMSMERLTSSRYFLTSSLKKCRFCNVLINSIL